MGIANGKPAVLVILFRQPEANMIDATVKPSGTLCSMIAMKTSKPTFRFTRKAEANRAGPGQKGSHKSRGDRRDMGPTSY